MTGSPLSLAVAFTPGVAGLLIAPVAAEPQVWLVDDDGVEAFVRCAIAVYDPLHMMAMTLGVVSLAIMTGVNPAALTVEKGLLNSSRDCLQNLLHFNDNSKPCIQISKNYLWHLSVLLKDI